MVRRSPRLKAKSEAQAEAKVLESAGGAEAAAKVAKKAAAKKATMRITILSLVGAAVTVYSALPLAKLDWKYVATWSVGMLAAWFILTPIFAGTDTFGKKPRVAAFNLVAMVPICTLTYYGLTLTFDDNDYRTDPAGGDGVLYRSTHAIPESALMCMIQIAYQIFGVVAGLIDQDQLFSTAFITHHVVTGVLGFLNLHPYIHYQIIYFGGVIEFSNIPLTVFDTFKHFPKLQAAMPSVFLFSKLSFALAFFVLRWFLWFPNAYGMHSDSYYYLQSGSVHSQTTVIAVVLGNIFISGLQILWGIKIAKNVLISLGIMKYTPRKAKAPAE